MTLRRKYNEADVFYIKNHPLMPAAQVSETIELSPKIVKELQDIHVEYSAGFSKQEGATVLTSAAANIAEETKRSPSQLGEGVIKIKPKRK